MQLDGAASAHGLARLFNLGSVIRFYSYVVKLTRTLGSARGPPATTVSTAIALADEVGRRSSVRWRLGAETYARPAQGGVRRRAGRAVVDPPWTTLEALLGDLRRWRRG
jgi:hypothetical protein